MGGGEDERNEMKWNALVCIGQIDTHLSKINDEEVDDHHHLKKKHSNLRHFRN